MLKNICLLAALAAAYFLCAGCGGTVRALAGDYDTDAPEVESISPLSGESGEEVTFKAVVCGKAGGAENPQYIWDFGTGAEPNISFDTEPTVVLRDGLRSPYTCTLTIKASCTGEDENQIGVTSFTLKVLPLLVTSVSPASGVVEGTATFSAVLASGVADSYQWDFGGACEPNSSTLANPVVRFLETGSNSDVIIPCNVIVGNAFEANQFTFNLVVKPKPTASTEHSQGSSADL